MTNQRFITILGYVATFTSVCMYVSYLQQIGLNLSGQKGGWLQPFATTRSEERRVGKECRSRWSPYH